MLQKFAIVDLETTGQVPANGDRIIQLAIVIIENGDIVETFSTYINPEKSIPLFIQGLTSITDADVAQEKPFEHYAQRVYDMLESAVFVAHNVDFDLNFLQSELQRVGMPPLYCKKIDTVELVKILYPTALSYQLADITAELGIEIGQAHRADDDALATAKLLLKLWERVQLLPLPTLEALHKHSFYLKSDVSHFMFEALQRKRSTVMHTDGFTVYRQMALKDFKSELQVLQPIDYPSNEAQKRVLFDVIPNFEDRPQQFEMMDTVYEAIESKKEVMIEASTGIGKTLAYLLPALTYASKNGDKVIVSTHTTNLMEQILVNELPIIEKLLGCRVPVAHVKGMTHFIDLHAFANYCQVPHQSYDELLIRLQILVWLTETKTGDLDELTISGGANHFIEKIKTSPNNKNANMYFYERAIENIQDATLIVTNHAMLLADRTRKNPIFPQACAIILDEAHQMLKVMTDVDSKMFSFNRVKYLIGQIGTYHDHNLFRRLQDATKRTEQLSLQPLYKLENGVIEIQQLFDRCMTQLIHAVRNNVNVKQPKQSRFIHELAIDEQLFRHFSNRLQIVIDLASMAVEKLATAKLSQLSTSDQIVVNEWKFMIDELKSFHVMWDGVFLTKSDHFAAWLEFDVRSLPSSLQFYQKPVQLQVQSNDLLERFPLSSVIWTSGTLTVPRQERFIADQLGISKETPIHIYMAPESYYSGARAYIIDDMPDIQSVPQQEYIEAVAAAIVQTVRALEGRSFVLFTSQQMLKETVELLTESQLLDDYMLFAQGVTGGSRMKLLKAFQKFNKSILFGTNSFWEGVDVPGDGLTSVIVVRLPFTSPDEPTFKAKSYVMQSQGINAFEKLSLPEAIIRFKQGFGRLIRSSTDRGAFIVLDRRIEKKSYGAEFIAALPNISVQKLPLGDMVLQLEHWYNNER